MPLQINLFLTNWRGIKCQKVLPLTWERYQDHEVIYPYYRVQEEGFGRFSD